MRDDEQTSTSVPLNYAIPDPASAPLFSPGQLRLLQYSLALCIATILYANIGGRIAQRWMGQRLLYPPATGTDIFDRWLIDYPSFALGGGLLIASLISSHMALERRWRLRWILFLPAAFVAWISTYLVCFITIWDEISP